MIHFCCENCGKAFSVPDSAAGRRASCKNCGAKLIVPDSSFQRESGAKLPRPPETPSGFKARARLAPETVRSAGRPAETELASTSTNSPVNPASPQPPAAPTRLPVRIRRLMADSEQMQKAFRKSDIIRIQSSLGNPADTYVIEYKLDSLARGGNGQLVSRDQHLVEIQLTREYPHSSPKCRVLTPIFHPNIEPSTICVGDHWTASERLVDLVVRIGEMLAYQAFNIQSPLDGEAAMWADLNRHALPTDRRDIHPPD